MANNDSISRTLTVAVLLCVICSVFVSAAAVLLRPAQEQNKLLDIRKNILMAAGIYQPDRSIAEQFSQVSVKLVELKTGKFSDAVDVEKYDQRKAEKDPAMSKPLSADEDIASISSLENYAKVYVVEKAGHLDTVILPIRGYGLWSTLRGFLALGADFDTVKGLGYYEQGETPGLGGEVDNPKWKALWVGKKVFDANGKAALTVIKGNAHGDNQVDALSGATLTSNGVANMLQFWLGENGFGRFIANLKKGEA